MTLIIAGYNVQTNLCEPSSQLQDNGLFVVSDSAITQPSDSGRGKTLLNGFRKVYKVKAQVWKPYFILEDFKDYYDVYETLPVSIAFAGNTLTAQHIINSITENLENIRISYEKHRKEDNTIRYTLVLPWMPNPLLDDSYIKWDEDTFLESDFSGLLTGELLANLIECSINKALFSASQYKLDERSFNFMYTELVAGLWCPVRKEHELYVYRMQSRQNESYGYTAFTIKEKVAKNQVVVLGERQQYEDEAQAVFSAALQRCIFPAQSMLDFLNQSVNQSQSRGIKTIAKPINLTTIKYYNIKTLYYN